MTDKITIMNDNGRIGAKGGETPQDIPSITFACCLLDIFCPNWILALCISSENSYTLSQKSCQFLTYHSFHRACYQILVQVTSFKLQFLSWVYLK